MGDPVARLLQRAGIGSDQEPDPVAKLLQGVDTADSDPVARLLGRIPPSSRDSTTAAPTDPGEELTFGQKYRGAVKGVLSDIPGAIVGAAKATLFDALRATVSPIRVGGRTFGELPPEVAGLFPESIRQPVTPGQATGGAVRTAATVAIPLGRSVKAAAALGGVAGAIAAPDEAVLGAALGATFGPAFYGAGKLAGTIAQRAGLKRAKGAPPPNAGPAETPPPPSTPPAATAVPPARSAIRDLSNSDILDMTPEGIKLSADQALKEERALYTELFGPGGARKYRAAQRRAESAADSPETAGRALATLESMRSSLSENQRRALDEINARGFTSKRLANIAKITKDFTPENLKGIADDEELLRMFGEVLMSKKPDRNLSGLYRLRALYQELDTRGISDNEVLRGTFEYMLSQGVKPEGLGVQIIGKMQDVRKTLSKVVPEKVQPEPSTLPIREELGTVSEPQLQQELAELVPPAAVPVDDAAARVQAARATPFPDIQTPISGRPLEEQVANTIPYKTLVDVPVQDLTPFQKDVLFLAYQWDSSNPTARQFFFQADQLSAQKQFGDLSLEQQNRLVQGRRERRERRVQAESRGAVEAVKTFAKDESGFIDFKRLGDVVEKFKSAPEGKLRPFEQEVQSEIVVGYKPPKPKMVPEGWYAALARKTMPLEKVEKKIRGAGGKITARESPAANIQLLSGWAGAVHHMMKWGGFRVVGGEIVPTGTQGLEPSLAGLRGQIDPLRRFLVSARVAELDSQGRRLVTNIKPESARLVVANSTPEVVAAGKNFQGLLRDVLQNAEDAGLVSGKVAAAFRFLGESYVPLAVVIDREAAPKAAVSGRTALSVPDPFDRLKGSGLKRVDPLQSGVDYMRRVLRASELNRVANSIVELTKKFPEETKDWIVERGKNAKADPSTELDISAKELVRMFKEAGLDIGEDSARETAALLSKRSLLMEGDWMRYKDASTGEVHQVKLEPGMAEIVRSLSVEDIGMLEQFLALGAQSVRVGVAVLDPVFALRQTVIDAFHAKMNSTYGFKIGRSTLDALVSTIKQDKNYRDFFAAGGSYSSFLPAGRGTEETLRSVLPKTSLEKVKSVVMNPIDAMAQVMDPFIELSKLGEFIAARRTGADVFEAALGAREVAGDLAMAGTKMAAMKRMTAFLGPYIAGTEKTFRTAREKPFATMARGIEAIAIPSALLWWAATGDDQVRDLQRGEQGKNWWFLRIGSEIVRIRKPQLWGQFFAGTMEAALDQMETENPEGYRRAMEGFAKELEPPGLPNVIQTWNGLRTGIDPRTGQEIVPSGRQELDPEFQFGYQTSEFSKRVGAIAGVSPAKIDYAIRNLGGTAAGAALAGADKLIGYDGVSPPTPVSADLPLLGQLFGRAPSNMAEPLTTFYKNADETRRKLNTMNELAEKFQAERFEKYVEENLELISLAELYAETRKSFTEHRQFIEEVRSYPDEVMSRDEKRELVDQALEAMIEQARAVNESAREIKKSNKQLQGAP